MAVTRGAKVTRVCENRKCGATFTARVADVRRGWAKFCSKSCKAVKQEQRTGQYARLLRHGYGREDVDDFDGSWDAHKGVF